MCVSFNGNFEHSDVFDDSHFRLKWPAQFSLFEGVEVPGNTTVAIID